MGEALNAGRDYTEVTSRKKRLGTNMRVWWTEKQGSFPSDRSEHVEGRW